MIKVKVNNEYKDVVKIFCGGTLQKEIIKVWSREAQEYVYESSVEYTGSLPVTINANGDALLDYRIYGADDGVGVATENLYNWRTDTQYAFIAGNGIVYNGGSSYNKVSDKIPVVGGKTYLLVNPITMSGSGLYAVFYNANNVGVSSVLLSLNTASYTLEAPPEATYFRTSLKLKGVEHDVTMFIEDSTVPTSYIPYGYKLPMIVNNGITNIVPPVPAETKTSNGITVTSDGKGTYTISGTATANTKGLVFEFDHVISCGSKNTVTLFNSYIMNALGSVSFIGQSGILSPTVVNRVWCDLAPVANRTLTGIEFRVPSGATVNGTISPLIFDGVNITPTEFVPYVPSVSYDVPVYIGENQLDAGEYVSYGEQKIYRDVSGTLTPTDPPVPLPEIPTINGETVIDYDGTPKPSQMYVKYRR